MLTQRIETLERQVDTLRRIVQEEQTRVTGEAFRSYAMQ